MNRGCFYTYLLIDILGLMHKHVFNSEIMAKICLVDGICCFSFSLELLD